MKKFVDIIIPRGGKGLVKKIQSISTIPLIGHLEGLCHSYVDKDANPKKANDIIHNAKLRNTAIVVQQKHYCFMKKLLRNLDVLS